MPTTTNYIWDEDNLLAEADGSNTIQAVYTNESEQYGNLISTRLPVAGTPTAVYHHFDATGSTRQLTIATGSLTDTLVYDAWGNVANRTGATSANHLWIGEVAYYLDVETRSFWVSVRPYNPLASRWTSIDPYEYPSPTNLYQYAFNSPITYIDPSGMFCLAPGRCTLNSLVFPFELQGCQYSSPNQKSQVGNRSDYFHSEYFISASFAMPRCDCCIFQQWENTKYEFRVRLKGNWSDWSTTGTGSGGTGKGVVGEPSALGDLRNTHVRTRYASGNTMGDPATDRGYSADKCAFLSYDSVGQQGIAATAAVGAAKGVTAIQFRFKANMWGLVVDKCNDAVVVAAESFTISCAMEIKVPFVDPWPISLIKDVPSTPGSAPL